MFFNYYITYRHLFDLLHNSHETPACLCVGQLYCYASPLYIKKILLYFLCTVMREIDFQDPPLFSRRSICVHDIYRDTILLDIAFRGFQINRAVSGLLSSDQVYSFGGPVLAVCNTYPYLKCHHLPAICLI